MKKKAVVILILCCMMCIILLPMSATANSAPIQWTGGAFGGTIFTDDNCPIEVKSEILTFDIPHFPDSWYDNSIHLAQYDAKVTAQYDFYNPTDSDITATAVFPIGNKPQYINISDKEYIEYIQSKSYISTDYVQADKQLRFTYCPYTEDFDVVEQLDMLQSSYIEHQFFTTELTVTKYTVKLNDFDIDTYSDAYFALDLPDDGEQRTVILQACNVTKAGASVRLYDRIFTANRLWNIVVLGQPFDVLSQIKLFADYIMKETEQLDGNITLEQTETTTLLQFASNCFETDSPVSETDRFNIVVSELTQRLSDTLFPVVDTFDGFELYDSHIMIWYSYQLTVPSNQVVANNVTVPIFPDYYQSGISQPKYTYTYLSTPASQWGEFGSLQIVFNCPYFFGANSLSIDEGTWADGFIYTYNYLPQSDITFTLTEINIVPADFLPLFVVLGVVLMVVLFVYLIMFVVGIVLLVKLCSKKK